MGNTRDSSGVSELSSVLLVHSDGGWFDWFVPLQAYKLSLCFSSSPCSLSTKTGRSAEQLLAADRSNYWLYPSKQAVNRFVLFAHLDRVLFPEMVSQATSDGWSLCPCCWRWHIIDRKEYEKQHRSHWRQDWARWIAHGGMRWVGRETSCPCSNHPNCHVLTTQFADSECSNCMTCWPGRYSRFTPGFTQYNHWAVPLICMAAVVQSKPITCIKQFIENSPAKA